MAIIRHGPAPEDHYSIIPNQIARDPTISLQAKGLYMYLRSHRSDWRMSTERIGDALGINRKTVGKYINELEGSGWLVKGQERSEGGLMGEAVYELRTVFPAMTVDQFTDDRFTDDRFTVSPKFTQHKKTNSFKKTKEKKNNKPSPVGEACSDGFEDWYSIYPRKAGKGQARRAYATALKKVDHFRLVEATRAFSEHHERAGTDKRYIPHPSTWLNGERWDDDLQPVSMDAADIVEKHLGSFDLPDYGEVPF